MSPAATVLLDMYVRHLHAAQQRDEDHRQRLFALIESFESEFPEAKAEIRATYPGGGRPT